jgi:hypothetical protein
MRPETGSEQVMSDERQWYIDEVAPHPVQEWGEPAANVPKDAETLLRHAAARGCALASIGVDMVGDTTPEGMLRHILNCVRTQSSFDTVVLLRALRELDPSKADEVAQELILAAEAGDSYGEWLWQWCDEMGMDADRLCDEQRAAYREWLEKREPRPFRVELYDGLELAPGHTEHRHTGRVHRYRWRVVHTSNGETIASGESYADKRDRDHAIDVLFPGVERVEVEA